MELCPEYSSAETEDGTDATDATDADTSTET
jgi:hypothetical protein